MGSIIFVNFRPFVSALFADSRILSGSFCFCGSGLSGLGSLSFARLPAASKILFRSDSFLSLFCNKLFEAGYKFRPVVLGFLGAMCRAPLRRVVVGNQPVGLLGPALSQGRA